MEHAKQRTRPYNSCFMACLSQTSSHKISKPLHTFLAVTFIIAYQQNSHTR